ncbi:MAG: hypothetical protein LBC02_09915, partial [Planctomycetaceae bacterium]|nr:hypothetical protein [Planctomycetaceae bacterium]
RNYSVAQARSIRAGQHRFPNGSTITALIYPISLSSQQSLLTNACPYALIFRSTFFDKNPS